MKPQICYNLKPVKKKLLSRTQHAGLLTFQVNENGCYRKVIVFVLFLFFVLHILGYYGATKTVSLFKAISLKKTKLDQDDVGWY